MPMSDAIGAFVLCALLITVAGVTGAFARVMDRIPQALAAALLAGVLARFAFDAFASLQSQFALVFTMFVVYLLGRRWWPRYAVPGVLIAGIVNTGVASCHCTSPKCSWPLNAATAMPAINTPGTA